MQVPTCLPPLQRPCTIYLTIISLHAIPLQENNVNQLTMAAPSDSPTPSPEMTRSSPPMILLQSPRKWRSQHLEAANLKQTLEVPALELLGDTYVPEDGDEGLLTRPTHPALSGQVGQNERI